MLQWANNVVLLVASALFLDKLVDCLNQTRMFIINDILLNRKPSLANRLGLTHDEDAQTHDLVAKTIQTHESRQDTEVLRDEVHRLRRRLGQLKTREGQALMKSRACLERKLFLLREKDKLDKQTQEHRKCMKQRWAGHCDEMRSLKQSLADTLKRKSELVSEVGFLRKEIRVQKHALRAKSREVKHIKILRKAASDEVRYAKALMENTRRRLEEIIASHCRFMMHRSQGNLGLRVRVAELRVQAKQTKLVCIRQAWRNLLTRMRVDSLRGELGRLRVDLVPESEVLQMKQQCYKVHKILKGMGVVFLVEGLACLGFFMMQLYM
ncbi:uncharacterized protein LOC119720831 [Patiria miniata]|uniref:Uncharacterized protein n=1 Tax=Patiria miniata TaxID=46514 RepID=A0A913Z455_PATMI|nr:uncharacterized protein LOC119720831 [Patiria miniata]